MAAIAHLVPQILASFQDPEALKAIIAPLDEATVATIYRALPGVKVKIDEANAKNASSAAGAGSPPQSRKDELMAKILQFDDETERNAFILSFSQEDRELVFGKASDFYRSSGSSSSSSSSSGKHPSGIDYSGAIDQTDTRPRLNDGRLPEGQNKATRAVDHTAVYGRIMKVTDNNYDFKIKEVSSNAKLDVAIVSANPSEKGKWQWVTNNPQFTVKVVPNGEDFTVRYK